MRRRLLNGPWAGMFCSLAVLALAAGAFSLTWLGSHATAVAAEPEEDPALFEDDAGGAAAPVADATETAEEDEESQGEMSYLKWIYGALGPGYMVIFLGLSFTLVALFVMNLLTANRNNVCPMLLVETFEQHLDEKQYQDAYELAKADESFLGHVLSAGLAKLSAGYSPAIEAMQEVGEEENMKLEHRLSYLALIGTISPMVGLFGTVHGMIAAFQTIAAGGSTPKASELASGISTALFTTLLGLAIAIPAIAAFNILKNRVARLVLEVGILSESLMSRFENVARRSRSWLTPLWSENEMRIKKAGAGIQEGDMTPMIDMTFQLIAFFMVLINFTQSEQNELIQLPDSELAKPPEAPLDYPITIHLTRNEDANRNGALDKGEDDNRNGLLDVEERAIIGGETVTIAGLSPYLAQEANVLRYRNKPLSEATIVIRGHKDTRTGRVQDLIRVCQQNNFEKFALRAKEDVGN